MSTTASPPTLEPIPHEECVRLLGTRRFGRLAVVDGDQPLVFPVNYVADGEHVVIRTALGSKLNFSQIRRVAFEVDHIDDELRTGWSVVVKGLGHEITTALDPLSEHLRTLPLESWLSDELSHWVRIDAEEITGRRLWSPPPAPPAD